MPPPSLDRAIAVSFAEGDRAEVRRRLEEYGAHPSEREADRVRWVVAERARGSVERVATLVATAKRDYRDVLTGDPGYLRLAAQDGLTPLPPLDTTPLFVPLSTALVGLLNRLTPEDWERPTAARGWRVRDVAAHVLDGDLRKLAACRDGHDLAPGRRIASERDLGDLVNGLNASGVAWAGRLSPRLLLDLLRVTGPWVADLLGSLAPDARAVFAVSWAGDAESPQWMDTGREYTERWHHQMQIRDAVGAPLLLQPSWMVPLVECSLRALPRAYADVDAADGTTVTLEVHGDTAGSWSLRRQASSWGLARGAPDAPDALVRADADLVWRLFYNAVPLDAARTRVSATGPEHLVRPLLTARSVIL